LPLALVFIAQIATVFEALDGSRADQPAPRKTGSDPHWVTAQHAMLCVRRRSKIQSAQKRTVISIYLCAVNFFPLTEDQLRQLIDAEACFVALEQARQNAKAVRGPMFWRVDKGRDYLVPGKPRSCSRRWMTTCLACVANCR